MIPNLRIGRFPWSYQAALLQDAPRATLLWLKPRFIFSSAAVRESRFVLHPTPGGPVPSRDSDRNPCDRLRSNETWAFTPTKIPSGGLSEWLQGHFVAQTFQSVDQGSADSVHVDPVKVIRTEFPVVFLTLQHVIGNN